MITYFKKPIFLAAVTVMLFAFAGCAGRCVKWEKKSLSRSILRLMGRCDIIGAPLWDRER